MTDELKISNLRSYWSRILNDTMINEVVAIIRSKQMETDFQ